MNENLRQSSLWRRYEKSMNPLKASREDGLHAIFYQRFWHIIGEEVAEYCIKNLADEYDFWR